MLIYLIFTDVKSDTCEQLVFLCGQCTQGFNSLDACKEHMVQVGIVWIPSSSPNKLICNQLRTCYL